MMRVRSPARLADQGQIKRVPVGGVKRMTATLPPGKRSCDNEPRGRQGIEIEGVHSGPTASTVQPAMTPLRRGRIGGHRARHHGQLVRHGRKRGECRWRAPTGVSDGDAAPLATDVRVGSAVAPGGCTPPRSWWR